MIGLVLISHSALAESMVKTVSVIIGEKDNISFLSLNKNEKMEDFSERLKQKVDEADKGGGVLIFADMFGGTPANVSLALFGGQENVGIITGFNLPVILEAALHSRAKDLKELTEIIMKKSGNTIIDAKAAMNKKKEA